MNSGRAPAAVSTRAEQKRLIAFGWYGGKFSHLNWLLPHLPTDVGAYCEPYGGSAAVLLNREPVSIETYNDLDGEVVNFFRVLRSRGEELVAQIDLTPYSREEYSVACLPLDDIDDEVERARRFYIRARMTRTGMAQAASLGRWSQDAKTSRRGMAGVVSRWQGGGEMLPRIVDRLRCVQIENRPALDVIRMYDGPDTLHYVDPPYVPDSRTDTSVYRFEMSEDEHVVLADALMGVKGKVALSGYRCEMMDALFKDWRRVDGPDKQIPSSRARIQSESLWMNW